MGLGPSSDERADGRDGDDAPARRALLGHLVRDNLSYVEGSIHVDGLGDFVGGEGHGEEGREGTYSRVRDQDVDARRKSKGCFEDLAGGFGEGDVLW